ncbi:peptidylprolyl isomerase [uncultured Eudoraea sp.]|uniref:peptidylprolyl isomerase n=1 Tax=uncultured Eudoraea sp. TaxID=1035614 RepID=UPI0026021110|nr:peptidylprolyl isomerase [uncultured Eudoraea sp.]
MKGIKRLIYEPLMHFLLIGAALFLLFGLTQEKVDDAPNLIVVSPSQMDQLAAQFKRNRLRSPSNSEMTALVESYVRNEVYYREALALGLDRNDPQVKQRMRLKLEFLLEDLTAEEPPGDELLNEFMQQNEERFFIQPQVSFQQLYLNPDKRADFDADAKRILKQLQQGEAVATLGDATMLPYELTQASQYEISRSFGEDFATDVVKLPVGDWSGPIYSKLGVHLVRVSKHTAGYLPELAQVRDQVERDYMAQRRQQLKDMAYEKLREGYEVVVEGATTQKDAGAEFTGGAVAATQAAEVAQK